MESALRTAVLEFVDTVRAVERTIAATRRGTGVPEEFDVAPLGEVAEEEWREHWPSGEPEDQPYESVDDTEEETDSALDGVDDESVDEAANSNPISS
jgi:XTP/dITP diphosphohydrolase